MPTDRDEPAARSADPVDRLATRIAELAVDRHRPLIVALDGPSGAGKSTLAVRLAGVVRSRPPLAIAEPGLPALAVIEGDDFYAGGSPEDWDAMSARQKVDHVIDWRRQRPVLDELRRGRPAGWYPYDWEAFDGRLATEARRCPPSPVVLLEGVYSGRPELADLVDLRVLLETPDALRRERLIRREGDDYADAWFARWTEAEELYFGSIMTPACFDLVLRAG